MMQSVGYGVCPFVKHAYKHTFKTDTQTNDGSFNVRFCIYLYFNFVLVYIFHNEINVSVRVLYTVYLSNHNS